MQDEFNQFTRNDVWCLIPRSNDMNVIDVHLFFVKFLFQANEMVHYVYKPLLNFNYGFSLLHFKHLILLYQ